MFFLYSRTTLPVSTQLVKTKRKSYFYQQLRFLSVGKYKNKKKFLKVFKFR